MPNRKWIIILIRFDNRTVRVCSKLSFVKRRKWCSNHFDKLCHSYADLHVFSFRSLSSIHVKLCQEWQRAFMLALNLVGICLWILRQVMPVKKQTCPRHWHLQSGSRCWQHSSKLEADNFNQQAEENIKFAQILRSLSHLSPLFVFLCLWGSHER